MSAQERFAIELPASVLDEIVARAVERLAMQQEPYAEPWIDVDQAARHLGYGDNLKRGRQRIYDLVSRKDSTRIPHRKEGARLLFKASELDRWIESGGAA